MRHGEVQHFAPTALPQELRVAVAVARRLYPYRLPALHLRRQREAEPATQGHLHRTCRATACPAHHLHPRGQDAPRGLCRQRPEGVLLYRSPDIRPLPQVQSPFRRRTCRQDGTLHEGTAGARPGRLSSARRLRHRQVRRSGARAYRRLLSGDDTHHLPEQRHCGCVYPLALQDFQVSQQRRRRRSATEYPRHRCLGTAQGAHQEEDKGHCTRPHQALCQAPPRKGICLQP